MRAELLSSNLTAVILLAALAGAALGALGARRNGARFADERLLWAIGGAVGAAIEVAVGALVGPAVGLSSRAGGALALGLWAAGSLLAALLTPALDAGGSRRGWLVSAGLKTWQCPLTTLAGLALAAAAGRPRLQLRQGTWFARLGGGRWALTLGAVVVAQREIFDGQGEAPPAIARHESYHARNAACLGEGGFYLVYLTLGVLRARLCRAPWNGLARDGRGNPFERTAYVLGHEGGEPPRA